MSVWMLTSKRKPSGGRRHDSMPKKKKQLGRTPALTRISEEPRVRKVRVLGGNTKMRALSLSEVNIYDPKKKKIVKSKIKDVMLNTANRHFVRMDVITKGAVLQTEAGFVKVTNRPGQEGIINGIFTEYKEQKGGTRIKDK